MMNAALENNLARLKDKLLKSKINFGIILKGKGREGSGEADCFKQHLCAFDAKRAWR